ncbi:hypothetical protein GGS26DRAFT_205188 [Hypomontagnella submonticulosa]|nr:hypothetical protein GGS26DRAFT_205188 [Hypomontagnella submonticulosa]
MTQYVTTLTDSHGRPTRTKTIAAQVSTGTIVFKDANGRPTSTGTGVVLLQPGKLTLTNYQGEATATEDYFLYRYTETLYDGAGHPTATRTSLETEIAKLTTLLDSSSMPTATETEFVPYSPSRTTTVIVTPSSNAHSESNKALHIVPMSDGKYFLGLMLPTFIAIILSIPIRIIDQNAKLYQPFHALASPQGAQACDTLCFQTAGIWNLKERVNSLLNGQILLTLTGLLLLASIVIIPLSSEAIHVAFEGPDCATAKGDTLTCTMALSVYPVPAQLAVVLLIFMMILVGAIIIVLRKWKTGLDWNPWSLRQMGHLAAHNEIRTLIRRRLHQRNGHMTSRQINRAFSGIPFVLDYWKDNRVLMRSILISNNAQSLKTNGNGKSVTFGKEKNSRQCITSSMPFFVLTWTGRLLFLTLLCTMEVGLLIYNIKGESQGYSRLMMGKWRVVRFILVSVGVLISLIWGSFFYAISFVTHHKLLNRIRLFHDEAVERTVLTNPFSGLRSMMVPGRRDAYLGVVSATAILSEILPLLLSTALDESVEDFWAHTVCLWMAVVVLSIMIFTICGSFFVAWPQMPIDPSTILGGMYYALTNLLPMSPSAGLLLGRASPNPV